MKKKCIAFKINDRSIVHNNFYDIVYFGSIAYYCV